MRLGPSDLEANHVARSDQEKLPSDCDHFSIAGCLGQHGPCGAGQVHAEYRTGSRGLSSEDTKPGKMLQQVTNGTIRPVRSSSGGSGINLLSGAFENAWQRVQATANRLAGPRAINVSSRRGQRAGNACPALRCERRQ